MWARLAQKDTFLEKWEEIIEKKLSEYQECTESATTGQCECPEGFYLRWGACRPCPKGCASCNRRGRCKECWSDVFELKRSRCLCPTGPMTDDFRDCEESCPAQTIFHKRRQKCVSCRDDKCLTCSPHPRKCTECGFGYTLSDRF